MFTLQHAIDVLLSIIMGGLAWFAGLIWGKVDSLQKDLAAHQAATPKEYVSKEDYRSDMDYVKNALDNILRALGDKADRS
jgi:hypothetical protein